MLRKLIFSLIAMLIVLPWASFSQSSVEVKANVLVLDSKDQFIDDLKLEDFKIYEDGVEQKLVKLVKKEPVLNLGLVIDNSGSVRFQLDDVIFFGQTIAENLQPKDEAFVVRFISKDKITIEQDWTSSKLRIQDTLNNLYVEGGRTAMIDALVSFGEQIDRTRKGQ